MSTLLEIFALVIVMAVVFALGYKRGKTIKEREMSMMEEPALSQEENEKRLQYYEFCKIMDEIMTEDDGGFSGDISKSSRTDTNKDEPKE